ncbi:MAG: 4-hydroxy-tetrahydrodipicolinate reductase [Minwuia sp.]|uniref:4-hydroxy-tetrahydrodipicolinate reductase n=1 Tax=Minwuia sp. TaxID=2493630 RepID=UPI003A87686F
MKIAIAGAGGRMGRTLVRMITEGGHGTVSGGLEHPDSPALGQDLGTLAGIGELGVAASADRDAIFAEADVVIDFTLAEATSLNALAAAEAGTAFVVGTTGMNPEQQARIDEAAKTVAVMQAGNMSLGVNLLVQVTKQVAGALGLDWDVEVVESHHRWKVDAPSGTALMLGKAAAEARGQDHDAVAVGGRYGITGERKKGEIGYAALRGGNVVGEHSVVFATDNERVTLGHIASDRSIFAAGAIRAALWVADKPAGIYDMIDVLGLKSDG